MTPRRLAAALVLIALAAACSRKPGPPAPDAGLPALLQAPTASLGSLSQLRGRAVVLDFWATWCPACVESLPHMNALAEKFAGRPVVFLSVTDEDRATVLAFMKTHPIKPWVGLDEGSRMTEAFGVREIPQTFVIDRYGRIRHKLSPSFLYASDIQDALDAPPPKPDNNVRH